MYILRLLKQYADPLNSRGYFIGPHAALAALALFTAFLLGAFTGGAAVHYGERYFQHHYQAPLTVPAKHVQLPRVGPKPSLPATAWVNRSILPSVTDQDGLGACESEATVYYQLSYAWRQTHPGSYLRFSPRYAYSVYSDNYSGGNDAGSDPVGILTGVNERGVPRFNQWPYPPNQIDSTAQLADASAGLSADQLAAKYKMAVSFQYIAEYPGGGQVAVDDARAQIAAGVPVNLGIPVYETFDNAGAYGGHVLMPDSSMQSRGGHAITIIGYDDTHTYDGITGWFRIRNSWTKYWGDGGNAWIPYAYVANYGFLIGTLHLGPATVFHPPHLLPGAHPGHGWRVHGVVTRDSGVNVSNIVNAAASHYHIWPVSLAALLGTESNVSQYAARDGYGCDKSYGLSQVNVCTAGYYGIGDGSLSPYNIQRVRYWEQVPVNAIWLAARISRDNINARGFGYPLAYGLYNCGAGASYASLVTPGNDCYTHLQVYRQWYAYANETWRV